MKKISIIFVVLSFSFFMSGKAQTVTLYFHGKFTGQNVALEKINVENLDKSCDTTIVFPDSTLVLHASGIDDTDQNPVGLKIFQNTPNPVAEMTTVKIFLPHTEILKVLVSDLQGKQVCGFTDMLEEGFHLFSFSPSNTGIYILTASTSSAVTQSIKISAEPAINKNVSLIRYLGRVNHKKNLKVLSQGGFVFSGGDHLRLTAYYHSLAQSLEDTPQNSKNYTFDFGSTGFTCGQSLTVNHIPSGGVAPVAKNTTYGTITNIPGEPTKCWITSNLGSDHQATAVDDNSEASAGWYWQFNRKQGFNNDGSTFTPAWPSTLISENSAWLTASDPCTIELGFSWRLPLYTEWLNVLNSGGWSNWNDPFVSGLKLHAAGYINHMSGLLSSRGAEGSYWCNTEVSSDFGWELFFRNGTCKTAYDSKSEGFCIRCIKDITADRNIPADSMR